MLTHTYLSRRLLTYQAPVVRARAEAMVTNAGAAPAECRASSGSRQLSQVPAMLAAHSLQGVPQPL